MSLLEDRLGLVVLLKLMKRAINLNTILTQIGRTSGIVPHNQRGMKIGKRLEMPECHLLLQEEETLEEV